MSSPTSLSSSVKNSWSCRSISRNTVQERCAAVCWCVLAFAHRLGALFSRRFCLPTDDFFSTPRTDALFSVQNRACEIVLTVKRAVLLRCIF